jgi:hypothetical protein
VRDRRRLAGAAALAMSLATTSACAAMSPLRVAAVRPSGPEVPANLLRLSLRFAAPVAGPVLSRLSLVRSDGLPIEEPFLEQELWSPDGRTLTVLLHPGRVKTGLVARQQLGPLLVEGEEVTLALDGHPLRHWRVGPDDIQGPSIAGWKLSSVRAGTRRPLVVTLDGPIDALDAGYLAVTDDRGHRVPGQAHLSGGEATWAFTPAAPWHAATYGLVAHGTLEDASGNRLGNRFETAGPPPAGVPPDGFLPFVAQPDQ